MSDTKKTIDLSQYEDVENDDNYSEPCVLACDAKDSDTKEKS